MANEREYREVRGELGFFGWVWRVLLALWQLAMIASLIDVTTAIAPMIQDGGATDRTVGALGIGLSWMFILVLWAAGTVILGMFVLLTRPPRAMVPIRPDESGA